MTPPLHTTQAVFPAEPDGSLLGHQAPAHDERVEASARNEPRNKERRSKRSQGSETGSSGDDSESEDDSWTRWEGVRYLGIFTCWHKEGKQSSCLRFAPSAVARLCHQLPLTDTLTLLGVATSIISAGKATSWFMYLLL